MGPDAPADVHVIGRDESATLRLHDDRVSRKHAELMRSADGWDVRDLKSRSGTFLDGRKLAPDERAPLTVGSVLTVGPFKLRLLSGSSVVASVPLRDDAAQSLASTLDRRQLGSLASQRLHVLLTLAGQIHRSTDLSDALDRVAEALLAGTRYGRALILRDGASGAERLAACATTQDAWGAPLSRTLLTAARKARAPVRLEDRGDIRAAASIMVSGVSSALCIPIIAATDDPLSQQTVAYLDSPSGTDPPAADAAAFAHAASDLAAMAIEADNRRTLQSDVDAMHQVQLKMMPPATMDVGALQVVTRCIPGRGAAGDIVGHCRTSDGGSVLIVGDVSGKGPAAAMLMASVVSHLDASLSLRTDIAAAMGRVNLHVLDRFQSERFVTAALVHASPNGRLQVMDAGHGIIARVAADGTPATLAVRGGPPLGAVPDSEYLFDELELGPGDRLLIFTDGVTEQNSSQGAMFKMEGALAALQGSKSAEEDTARLISALRDHAGQANFDDDVTVVSIGRRSAEQS